VEIDLFDDLLRIYTNQVYNNLKDSDWESLIIHNINEEFYYIIFPVLLAEKEYLFKFIYIRINLLCKWWKKFLCRMSYLTFMKWYAPFSKNKNTMRP
jgi:hypothetical protein